jgi:hypothetical protein
MTVLTTFYSESPLVILTKVKLFCGRLALLKGDSLDFQRHKLDPNLLKFPLFDGYINPALKV